MFKRLAVLLVFLPLPVFAQQDATERFFQLLRLEEMVAVIREEGLVENAQLPEAMMLGTDGPAWDDALDRIYRIDALLPVLEATMARSLNGGDLSIIIDYLETPAWQVALDLELAARMAMLDPNVEEAAFETYDTQRRRNSIRMRDLEELVETADLIESNVVSALNSMLQFNLGLMSAGLEIGYSEDELLTQIWADEEFFRADATDWVFTFMLLAYAPMERQMLRDQIEFFATAEGQRLNRALIEGFDEMFNVISFKLGEAIGEMYDQQSL
ncbi:MAG: hypothetical protein QGI08_14035 [Paracoccaceae bacterium]|jgi:hypothetical protein|nr:hypothetical protein [Paracoccaceae bacterium]